MERRIRTSIRIVVIFEWSDLSERRDKVQVTGRVGRHGTKITGRGERHGTTEELRDTVGQRKS